MIAFQESLTIFLSQMYWIDITAIVVLLCIVGILVTIKSRILAQQNKTYNESLRSVRVEIFHQYEKNFFL